jgi:hypothetical protein
MNSGTAGEGRGSTPARTDNGTAEYECEYEYAHDHEYDHTCYVGADGREGREGHDDIGLVLDFISPCRVPALSR